MTKNTDKLIRFAINRNSFSDLSEPKQKLLQKITEGDAKYSEDEDHTLRACLIVWLCTDSVVQRYLTHLGLKIVGAIIKGPLNLRFASVDFPLVFQRCEFTEAIRIDQATIKFLDFSSSYVTSIDAQGAEIKGDVNLDGFKAVGRVSFLNANIDDVLQLKDVRDPKKMILNLSSARILTLKHQKASWPDKYNLFLDVVYKKIELDDDKKKSKNPNSSQLKSLWKKISIRTEKTNHLDWLRHQNHEVFAPQPYEHLAQVIQASGNERVATKVLIGKHNDLIQYGQLGIVRKCLKYFLGFTIAHGYNPHKALLFALVFVLFGMCLFSDGYSQCPQFISPYDIEKFNSDNYPIFNRFIYSIDVFVPIMDLHQQSYWLPNANKGEFSCFLFFKCTGSLLRWYFWAHIALGWIVTSLWVAGFTGLVRSAKS